MKVDSQAFNAGHPARPSLDDLGLVPMRIVAQWRSRLAGPVLMLGDLLTFVASYGILAAMGAAGEEPALQRGLVATALICIVLLQSAALYPGYRLHPHELLRRRVSVVGKVGLAACAGAGFVLGDWTGAAVIAAFLAIATLLAPGAASAGRRLLRAIGGWGEPVEIVAPAARKPELKDFFCENWQLGVIPLADDANTRARVAVVCDDEMPDRSRLEAMRGAYDEVVLLADTPSARLSGLRAIDVDGAVGLRLGAGAANGQEALRRLLDLAVAVPAAVCFAPLMLGAAAAIWIVDPGPIFYRQIRVGLGGRPLSVLKLRTMYQDAEKRLAGLIATDPEVAAEWAAHFKLKDDPRILPYVGKVLRSSSLDELPQLFNVIAGDMSLVGPRPLPDYHLAAMPADFRSKRSTVIPGITGLWQISARSEADLEQHQQIDDFYIDNRSLWLDLLILLRTAPAVLRRRGAY